MPSLRSSSSTLPISNTSSVIQIAKIACAFHPNEYITNFCTCQICLLPLCPSCIKIHTNEHIEMKNLNPQYEAIGSLLTEVYGEVKHLISKYQKDYSHLLDVQNGIQQNKTAIHQRMLAMKAEIIAQVERYFVKMDEQVQNTVDSMNYMEMIRKYKNEMKKNIMGLKSIAKSFNPQNQKIMRVLIKYKSLEVKQELQKFDQNLTQFLNKAQKNVINFSIREDYKSGFIGYLDRFKRVQVTDGTKEEIIPNISAKLREVFDRSKQENKKDLIKSIGTMLAASGINGSQMGEAKEIIEMKDITNNICRNSICSSSWGGTPSKENNRRRSVSKGKGLSLMVLDGAFNIEKGCGKAVRAVNICEPIEFQRTAIICREK